MIFGITKENYKLWTPVDSIAYTKMMQFSLDSWFGVNDIIRESLRQMHPDLAEMVEEIAPFTNEFIDNMVTIVDDDDLKAWG